MQHFQSNSDESSRQEEDDHNGNSAGKESEEEQDGDIYDIKSSLLESFDAIQSSGSFASSAPLAPFVDPGLVVGGIGAIPLPLNKDDADNLIAQCHQAPFGKGEQTIVDKAVRNTWELSPENFALQSPQWNSFISKTVTSALNDLGVMEHEFGSISYALHKLLLYEEGAMFKPHKDSEKAPGMFGTLVICLPSVHQGGDVITRHAKMTKTFTSSGTASASYICRYSDVLHEVTKVTSGYRLVLTYNLISKNFDFRPSAAVNCEELRRVRRVLDAWKISGGDTRLIHQLEHEYTESGMKLNALKGRDAEVVSVLEEACHKTGFVFFLASCEREVWGGCDDGYGYGRSRYQGFQSYHEIIDTVEDTLTLKRVVDTHGNLVGQNMDTHKDMFLKDCPFDEREPDDEDFSGFTGNEGANATQWYRDTVRLRKR
ncbi:hypothetical protein BT63DRAFT_372812 [Microthyrium microscopicum]|uniref:Prolyl 4-hydroxylase alpha subunit Fe(2+) 2OG dioxygenase domain-containing protein n=1 Tax=Microthyrium microscopicum TaxID=703497 RepID=A0A6A6UDI5_9PEZI|nr:hypothetical protein BT63DRAFT_372812 [Microthyrium microscopicum]